ncbi:hypothetical protein F511_41930 [Dorcoceras hygrometricum]|uniref:Uncharacterized protein n=1 Tax=Dorcoceras hygrometricum TaxID=472368 RepID=A0A2Z6ZZB1_9LAMI|nr:hypothetical protein F511_41930 [Dorcoceras hygrometricum]
MSLFDLQDVCIAIGSLATLDLPMVVDLIGIYVLKGPYCTLTTTNWFLQALSVIPRGSWGDVARRFTMIQWAPPLLPLSADHRAPPTRRRALPSATSCRDRTCSDQLFEEFPLMPDSSGLLVQADEGIVFPVVDLIRRSTAAYLFKCRFPCETCRSQAPRRQQGNDSNILCMFIVDYLICIVRFRGKILTSAAPPGNGIRIRHFRQQWYQSTSSDPSIHITV